ncbi:unknown [Proteobacteria bacterium CAG:495]|jgi:hypothetical protein|nr:unknown [Proteobacteria bacterium CAG:495]
MYVFYQGMQKSDLHTAIANKYNNQLTDEKVDRAVDNLVGLYSLLLQIDLRIKRSNKYVMKGNDDDKRNTCTNNRKKQPAKAKASGKR